MKKILYFVLLVAELFVGVLLMSALWSNSLYIPAAATAVVLVAMMTWQTVLLKRAPDAQTRRKIMLRIALVMLIPVVVFIVTYIAVAVALIIAFI